MHQMCAGAGSDTMLHCGRLLCSLPRTTPRASQPSFGRVFDQSVTAITSTEKAVCHLAPTATE